MLALLGLALTTRDLRMGGLALAAALLTLVAPSVARWPIALLVGGALMRGAWPAVGAALALLAAIACWPRGKTFGRRLLVTLATFAIMVAATHQLRLGLVGGATALVLLAPLEGALPRGVLALVLALAAVPSAIAAYTAHVRFDAAEHLATDEAWKAAQQACEALHAESCTALALEQRAKLARGRGDDAAALELLGHVPEPASPTIELAHADVELLTGHASDARARLLHLAESAPSTRGPLAPETALQWAHMLARLGHRDEAFAVLAAVSTPDAARYRAVLRPTERAVAEALPTEAPEDHCLRAWLLKSIEDAKACVGAVPDQVTARAMLGMEPIAPKVEGKPWSFAETMALRPVAPPPSCIHRGEPLGVTLRWLVYDGFAPGEHYLVFVHVDGPGRQLNFDHALPGRETDALIPGEELLDPINALVPGDAPAGRYQVHVGLYAPENGLRLHPRGLPWHISYVDPFSFEVCP